MKKGLIKQENLTLRKLGNILKGKKINYSKDESLITASHKKTTSEGFKINLKLTIEKVGKGTIIGSVRGLGRSVVCVHPQEAISAFCSRRDLLR